MSPFSAVDYESLTKQKRFAVEKINCDKLNACHVFN